MRQMTVALSALLLLLPLAAGADVIHVPADQPTIQAGIDWASDGDTVLVADGTYTGPGNRELSFHGKEITVRSEYGPENCVVDCESAGQGFYLWNGEGSRAAVEGFTIIHAYNQPRWKGGAITIRNGSSPLIRDNIIKWNVANCGAGIYVDRDCRPTITNNVITENTAISWISYPYSPLGGGIYVVDANPTIENNIISANSAESKGGGIHVTAGDPIIRGNIISGNTAVCGGGVSIGFTDESGMLLDNTITGNQASNGGGVYTSFATTHILNNDILDNSANSGGGIYCYCYEWEDLEQMIISNTITENSAEVDGGGIYLNNVNASATNNLITENVAGNDGGGIFFHNSDSVLEGLTIANNDAPGYGGGICCTYQSDVEMENSILAGNGASTGSNIFLGDAHHPSTMSVQCLDVLGGHMTVYVGGHCVLNQGEGLMDKDPDFTSGPVGDFYLGHTATGQTKDSPCIDAGSGPATDICCSIPGGAVCLGYMTTRSDGEPDSGPMDLGFHDPITSPYIPVFAAEMTCVPVSGTLPFVTIMTVSAENLYTGQTRRAAFRIDIDLAAGQHITGWKNWWNNIAAGGTYNHAWGQPIPNIPNLVGVNTFTLTVADVTPAPYNLPPYPPAGHSDTDICEVEGVEP